MSNTNNNNNNNTNTDDLPEPVNKNIQRHVLKVEEELRVEVSFSKTAIFNITLLKGSAELQGIELALNNTYNIATDSGGLKIAIFTWYGCVIDIESNCIDIIYTSDETNSNIAAVNTHAQLEALRDEANSKNISGPRVLIVGPHESGKTSLAKVLCAYAVKLGRTPVFVDLDPIDNCLTIPGTLSANVMTSDSITIETYATTGLPVSQQPLVLWYGSANKIHNIDLYRAQVTSLAKKINQRCKNDEWVNTSGLIVNTNGYIQDDGFQLLLNIVQSMQINIILVIGHDRLYSMMKKSVTENNNNKNIKIIKVPRSGGVVSRENNFMIQSRSRCIKRYFYGNMIEPPNTNTNNNTSTQHRVIPQLTPFAIQITYNKLIIYKYTIMNLSASLLPVYAATQSTESVQLTKITDINNIQQYTILAICHPQSVLHYEESNNAKDLYEHGVAGFVVVEKIIPDTDMIHLLSPCAGNLPSYTLLVGDITWME